MIPYQSVSNAILKPRILTVLFLVLLVFFVGKGCARRAPELLDVSSESTHSGPVDSVRETARAPRRPKAGDQLFGLVDFPLFHLQFADEDREKLQAEYRPYVRCVMIFTPSIEKDSIELKSVGLKLKGAAGSYRGLDDKPAFTIKTDKFRNKQELDGLEKLHLNNSVQDESYLNEWLGCEMYQAAGYPAPRVSHAVVSWNDRPKQAYVLRESFDKKFLTRWFADATGNLYEGGFVQDIDGPLEKDAGQGPDDRSDLKRILEVLRNPNFQERQSELESLVDMDRFLTFMALERMLGHWDGYCNNNNNYRIYFDPSSRKAVFLPHGMDQILGDTGMGLFDQATPLVSSQVIGSDKWRALYRKKIAELLPVMERDEWQSKLDSMRERLLVGYSHLEEEQKTAFGEQVQGLKDRLKERVQNIKQQLSEPDPPVISLNPGESHALVDWYPISDREEIMPAPVEVDGEEVLVMSIPPEHPGFAGWNSGVWLASGNYRWSGEWSIESAIEPLEEQKESVLVRTGGDEYWKTVEEATEEWGLEEKHNWRRFSGSFQIVEDRRFVEFGVGIRASRGEIQVRKGTLKLERLGN